MRTHPFRPLRSASILAIATLALAVSACGNGDADPEDRCPDGSIRTDAGCPGEELCPDGSEPGPDGCPDPELCPDGSAPVDGECPGEPDDPCDLCTDEEVCIDDACEPLPENCPCPLGSWCDEAADRCVAGCQNDGHCAEGRICEDDACRIGCRDDDDCAEGEHCDDAVCAQIPPDEVPDHGWTDLSPHADTLTVYVSSSLGDDADDGLSPETAVRTILRGYAILRDGEPDWLLLRRGDTFDDERLGPPNWTKSGRDADAPMVVSTWGDDPARPRVLTPAGGNGLTSHDAAAGQSRSHLRFVGFHLEPAARATGENPVGIRWLGSGEDILFEDVHVGGYATNVLLDGTQGSVGNVRIRRSVIVDAWSTTVASRGLLADGVDGLLVEENVFDRNGWHPDVVGAERNADGQNLRFSRTTAGVVVRGNLIARGSGSGLEQRGGGLTEDNLFVQNPVALQFGDLQLAWPGEAATGVVRDNVIFDGADVGETALGVGIRLQKARETTVAGNLVAFQDSGTGGVHGIIADYEYEDVSIAGNVVRDWAADDAGWALRLGEDAQGGIQVSGNVFQQPDGGRLVRHVVSFDPGRFTYADNVYHAVAPENQWFQSGASDLDLAGWTALSGETGAVSEDRAPRTASCAGYVAPDLDAYLNCNELETTLEAFLSAARGQSRPEWRPELTPASVNRWLRRGHDLSADGVGAD